LHVAPWLVRPQPEREYPALLSDLLSLTNMHLPRIRSRSHTRNSSTSTRPPSSFMIGQPLHLALRFHLPGDCPSSSVYFFLPSILNYMLFSPSGPCIGLVYTITVFALAHELMFSIPRRLDDPDVQLAGMYVTGCGNCYWCHPYILIDALIFTFLIVQHLNRWDSYFRGMFYVILVSTAC